MSLKKYKRMRNFAKTPEPSGGPGAASSPTSATRARPTKRKQAKLRFVIQKHDATALHYDFRLEFDGVLKSWAVPKGPSLDPADRRLAVEVEDHPIEYGSFEGTIPLGEYGGGTVMLWDRGTWEPQDDDPRNADPAAALKKGRLSFVLHGKKLNGAFILTRTRRDDVSKPQWLLIKRHDGESYLGGADVLEQDKSVKTGRSLEAIALAGGITVKARKGSRARAAGADSSGNVPPRAKPRGAVWHSNRPAKPAERSSVRRTPASVEEDDAVAVAAPPRRRSAPRGVGIRSLPPVNSPQLCTLADHPPRGPGWVHEIKFDGYRLLVYKEARRVHLITRKGLDWSDRFAPIARAFASMNATNAIIDGEAVILDEYGNSSFQLLQQAIKQQKFENLAFYAFDLLWQNGRDLRPLPLIERKEALRRLLRQEAGGLIRFSEHIEGHGEEVQAQACKAHLEGVVSKREDAPYEEGRSRSWVKSKCGRRQEFVVVGWTPPSGARAHFGSLILAAHNDAGKFVYTGRVGTGFNDAALRDMWKRIRELGSEDYPLNALPSAEERRGVTWIKPKLVVEVSFTEWTHDGRLRHPSFEGLREDKECSDVKIERPKRLEKLQRDPPPQPRVRKQSRASDERPKAPGPVRPKASPAVHARGRAERGAATQGAPVVAGINITHPERVVFEDTSITKLDVARYYEFAAERLLPYIANRPLSTLRCPSGEGSCFFQKHVGGTMPPPVKSIPLIDKGGKAEYIGVDSLEGLITLVQFNVLELHPWGSTARDLERPDVITFDFDPGPGVEFEAVKIAALRARDMLIDLDLVPFLKTSGGKGLHVVVPLKPKASWDEVKDFARSIAEEMSIREPERYVANMSKSKREGRIFVDYLRNGRGQTSVAPYSLRARANGPVSLPIRWEDLATLKSSNQFTIRNVAENWGTKASDPWKKFDNSRQALTAARLKAFR